MHSCLSTNFILCEIISKLNLREKFGVQGVCRQWKNIAIQCLRHHECLVISERRPSLFRCSNDCNEHTSLITVNKNHLIWGKYSDLEFWQKILSLLQGAKCLYMDLINDYGGIIFFREYKAILQSVIDYCGQSLECLCIPGHSDYESEIFPVTDSLPSLKHMLLGRITPQVTKNILSACPNLQYLRLSTSFTEWQNLPKGFKKLQNHYGDLHGINNLLCSPAVQSLEFVSRLAMTSQVNYQSYFLPCLKILEVIIEFDVTNCLRHLVRILSFAPVLCELRIIIDAFDEIEPQVWIKVLSECQNLTDLTVFLTEPSGTEDPLINVSLFQDDFAKTVVSKIKKLEYLYIGFHLSSDGLRLLSHHENLKHFHHEIHTEHMCYDSVFDTDALVHFLSQALSKNLTSYGIYIPTAESYGEYLILKESFLDFAYKIEQQYFVRLNVFQDDRHFDTEIPHPEKIPGMIYVTGIYLSEWNLLRLEMFSDDEEEEENDNLLFSLMATQSHVHGILLESSQK